MQLVLLSKTHTLSLGSCGTVFMTVKSTTDKDTGQLVLRLHLVPVFVLQGTISLFFNAHLWARMMAQQMKALATKSDDFSLISKTYIMEGENQLCQLVLFHLHTSVNSRAPSPHKISECKALNI